MSPREAAARRRARARRRAAPAGAAPAGCGAQASAERLDVHAASSPTGVLTDLAERFEREGEAGRGRLAAAGSGPPPGTP